jgi:glucose inhibited division protein A
VGFISKASALTKSVHIIGGGLAGCEAAWADDRKVLRAASRPLRFGHIADCANLGFYPRSQLTPSAPSRLGQATLKLPYMD